MSFFPNELNIHINQPIIELRVGRLQMAYPEDMLQEPSCPPYLNKSLK